MKISEVRPAWIFVKSKLTSSAAHVRTCRKRSLEVIWHVKSDDSCVSLFSLSLFLDPIKICTRANYIPNCKARPLSARLFLSFLSLQSYRFARSTRVLLEKKDIFHAKHFEALRGRENLVRAENRASFQEWLVCTKTTAARALVSESFLRYAIFDARRFPKRSGGGRGEMWQRWKGNFTTQRNVSASEKREREKSGQTFEADLITDYSLRCM